MGYDLIASAVEKRCAGRNARDCSLAKKDLVAYARSTTVRTKTLSDAARKGQGRNRRHGQGLGILFEEDHDAFNKEWQRPPGFHSSKLQKFPCDNLLPCAANCEPCPPHAHKMGFGPHCVDTTRSHCGCAAENHRLFFRPGEHGEALSMISSCCSRGKKSHCPGIGEGLEVTRSVRKSACCSWAR